jgi:filamentous hemagglutinin family protein
MIKAPWISLVLMSLAGGAFAQSAADALPTGGRVVAGQAIINHTGNTMNVVQASQRAVVNWDSFNIGKNAKVEIVQPNAQAVIHHRVNSVSATQIDGMLKSNGQVVISNSKGVSFGTSAQIDVGSIVATTMDINDKDFMEGKSTFKGNGTGAVVNHGKIQTKDPKGYIALLAPEVRNEGYILAKGGAANVVALASGSQVTLDFRGDQLMTVKVDASAYKSLIENKRVVQVEGGLVVIAANSAAQLMGSVIKNSGRISTSSMVNNGGVIEILADNVQNSGAIMANAKGSTGNGGQINIKGNTIALADSSKIKANAKEQGNGGQIIVLSEKKTQVSGVLEAKGGKTSGNGGFIDTSSKEVLEISSKTKVDTSARNTLGKAGTWLLDPMDLLITTGFAQVISDALQNNNVTVQVQGNVCSGGSCTQNGSGNLTIDHGVTISKTGGVKTVLTFLADGTFYNYGVINQAADSILEVVIQAQNVNLAQNSKIEVNKVTIIAVNSVTGYGSIIGAGANPLVNILANIFNFHGAITVNSRAQVTVNGVTSNSATVGTIRITADELTLASTGKLEANGDINAGTIILSANGTGIITIEGLIQTNGGNGRGGEINISQADDIHINNAIIQSNGNNGGYINIFTNSGDLILQNALIQTNGSNGRGGSIGISATNNTLISDSNIEAKGLNQGGIILIGNDADNGTLPFSISVTLDNANIDVSATNNLNNQDINQIKIDAQNDLLINNSTLKANGEQGGQIYLNSQYQDLVFDNSVIQTNGSNGRGGTVEISSNSGNLTINSTIQATGATVGGTVLLTADHILLDSNTLIDVTGNSGGGSVLVGGDWQGGNNQDIRVFPNRDIHQSTTVTMNADAVIDASAKINGDGGVVVIWSDITNFDSITEAKGSIRAMGGSISGQGGKVETSGARLIFSGVRINTLAADGSGGLWLLDPYDFFLDSGELSTIATNLNNNGDITISTGNTSNGGVNTESYGYGHIVFMANFSYGGSNDRTLTLTADADIYIQGNISATGSGRLSVNFNASGDQVYLNGDISTNGGSISFGANDVHFQKTSGNQSITTAGGNLSFNSTNIVLLRHSGTGTVSFDTGSGSLSLGSGSVSITNTQYGITAPTLLMEWGGRSNYGERYYYNNIVAGREYSFRLWIMDSWDSERGEVLFSTNSTARENSYFIFWTSANCCSNPKLYDTGASAGTVYTVGPVGQYGHAGWDDVYVDITFKTTQNGFIRTWNNLNEPIDNESFEINNLRETGLSSNSGFTTGGRSLSLTSTSGAITGSGNISGLASLTVNTNNASSSLSGVISGTGTTLTKQGTGTLTLTGGNTYTGLTTVSSGTLNLAPSGDGEIRLNGGMVNNANVSFDGSMRGSIGGGTFINGASGSGTWAVSGTTSGRGAFNNRLVLEGNTTISGQVTVTNYGNFWLESTGINATSPIFLDGANTYLNIYNLTNTVMKIGALSGNGRVLAQGAGVLTLSLGNGDGSATFSGVLANAQAVLSLTKEGSGTQTLSGLSDYSGVTNVNGGTLKISSTGKIYQTDITIPLNVNSGAVLDVHNWDWGGSLGNLRFEPVNLVINGGTVRYSGVSGGSWRSFTVGSSGATFESPTAGVTWNLNNSPQAPVIGGNLTFNGAGNIALGHTITGSGYSLTKNGSGTLTLSGANTYSGSTTISAGTLSVTGTLGGGNYSGAISNAGVLNFNSSSNQILNGVISGAGSLTKDGSGTLSLTGNNTYSLGTTVSTGTIGVYHNGALGSGSVSMADSTTLLLGRAVTEIANNISITDSVTVAIDLSVEYLVVGGGGGGGGIIGGGGGGGGLVMSSANLVGDQAVTVGAGGAGGYYWNSSSQQGQNGGDSRLGSIVAAGGGGGAGYGNNWNGFAGGSGGGGANTGTGGAGSYATDGLSYTYGNPGGNSQANQSGGGGGAGGAGGNAIGTTSGAGGAGGIGIYSSISGTLTGYAGGGGGAVRINWGTAGAGATSFGGGNGTASRSYAGSGVPNTGGGGGATGFTEGTQNAAELWAGYGGSGIVIARYLGGVASTATGAGATGAAGTSLAAGYYVHTFKTVGSGTLSLSQIPTKTFSGVISGTGNLNVNATGGTVSLTRANTYSGNTSISGGTLTIGGSGSLNSGNYAGTISNAGTLIYASSANQIFAGAISGTGSLIKNTSSSVLTLSANNTYTGATTVNAGTVALTGKIYCGNAACTLDQNSAGIVTVTSGATLEFKNWEWLGSFGANYYEKTYIVIDGGTLKYSGLTDSVNNRGFTVQSNGATFENATAGTDWGLSYTSSSNYQAAWNGGVTFSGVGNITVGHVISGANAVRKTGTGTLTLTATNTYSGGTTISGGTLKIKADNNLGATPASAATNITINGGSLLVSDHLSAITIHANRTIALGTGGGTISNASTTNQVTVAGAITGANALRIGSDGNTGVVQLTGLGANAFSGGLTVSYGTYKLGSSSYNFASCCWCYC